MNRAVRSGEWESELKRHGSGRCSASCHLRLVCRALGPATTWAGVYPANPGQTRVSLVGDILSSARATKDADTSSQGTPFPPGVLGGERGRTNPGAGAEVGAVLCPAEPRSDTSQRWLWFAGAFPAGGRAVLSPGHRPATERGRRTVRCHLIRRALKQASIGRAGTRLSPALPGTIAAAQSVARRCL